MSSLWQRYRSLPAQTRILIGGGLIAYALVAQAVVDRAEEPLGLKATEEDKQGLWRAVLPNITVVDREDGLGGGQSSGTGRGG